MTALVAHADRQGIDEHADQVAEAPVVPSVERNTDDHVVLKAGWAKLRDEYGVYRKEDHERCGVCFPTEPQHARGERLVEYELVGRCCVAESMDALNLPCAEGQIARASSVNAAATRRMGGVSMARS